MNDFLQTLRSSHIRSSKREGNRHHTGLPFNLSPSAAQHSQDSPRRPLRHHPVGQAKATSGSDHAASLLVTMIDSLSRQIETLAENQGKIAAAQERTSAVIERQTDAMEKIIRFIDRSGVC